MSVVLPISIELWAGALQRTINDSDGLFKRVVLLDETDSTQDAARRMDAQIGDVILTGRQTAGRGRLGRAWADTGEHGVAMTVVMKPDRPERMATIAAVGLAWAIEIAQKVTTCPKRQPIGIKWPNDVMLGERKLGGVLCEARWQGDALGWVASGIGINVTNPLPAEVEGSAVRLDSVAPAVTVDQLIEPITAALRRLPLETDRMDPAELADFQGRDWLQGKALVEPKPGIARGISNDGALVIEQANGKMVSVRAGRILLG